MYEYKPIAESNSFIVLEKYTKEWETAESYQSEGDLKKKFKKVYQFGFTGTPIFPQNALGAETTATVFGRESCTHISSPMPYGMKKC